jgi:hypothetical protein
MPKALLVVYTRLSSGLRLGCRDEGVPPPIGLAVHATALPEAENQVLVGVAANP